MLPILVGLAALAPGSLGGTPRGGRASRQTNVGLRLPAPVTVAAGRSVSFLIGRDGRVHRIPTPDSLRPFPQDAVWFPGTDTWFRLRHGRLIVGRGREPLWRSRGEIASRWQLGLVSLGPHTVAFQHDHKLFLAPLRGAERPVARAELPLGWTRGGLYTYRYRGRELLLRSDTGALLKTIARRPLGSDYVVANGSLYFITHGVLVSAHGARTQRLASLASLGVSAGPWLQSLGRLLELQDNNRLVVLRPDGSLFAWTPLPRSQGQSESISSSLVAAPHGSAVAFAAAAGGADNPDAARPAHGTETVYLLRPGARMAFPAHTERVDFKPCERGASLQWHGHWLLYSNSEGNLTAIDTTGAHHAIELSSLVHSLPGTRDGLSATWSEQPFEL
ncbi:MAG TPA: hypothetical protein VG365_07300 [Solirubrobacteraceae bacterium]|nr:hypothetical protein [Solirubrobacteraceae bacterium]